MKSDAKDEVKEIKKEPKFDLKDVEVEDDFEDNIEGIVSWKTIELQKPDKDDWFRLYPPDLEKGFASFKKGIITIQKDARNNKQTFLIMGNKNFRFKAMKDLKPSTRTILCYGITSTKMPFIWNVNFNPDHELKWHTTSLGCAKDACTKCMKIVADKPNDTNIVITAPNQHLFPKMDMTKFPSYEAAIEMAFKGRIIFDEDHYAYQKAMGLIA
mgnify:CR=1 FL=1|tara:strand:+ start:3871 stop:4509 length:639 start_codon:yes stop_codon:yes gene_type:complete